MKGEFFMGEKTIFPKIKDDNGGRPVEYVLEQVSLSEMLRAPEDVTDENEISKGYTDTRRNFFAGWGN